VSEDRGCAAAGIAILAAALFSVMSEPSARGAVPERPTRYDHASHAAKAKKEIACNACHKLSEKTGWAQKLPVGRAGEVHTPCSDAGCHQSTYLTMKKGRNTSLCFTCHVSKFGKKLIYPPYRERGPSNFFLAKFSHEVHINAQKKGCEACHAAAEAPDPVGREMKRAGHEACSEASCHGARVKPPMGECTGCHTERKKDDGVMPARSLEPDWYRARPPFSHAAHKAKSKDDQCIKCHANAAVGAGAAPPLPPMPACEKCHDGESAFRALGTTCGRCHVRSPKGSPELVRTSSASATGEMADTLHGKATMTSSAAKPPSFEHARHANKVGLAVKECTGCHEGSKPNGRLKFPGIGHKPCSNEACHAVEFRKRGTMFCLVCHDEGSPFGKNPTKTTLVVPATRALELEVPFSHKTHLAKKALMSVVGPDPCARCHAREIGAKPPEAPAGVIAPSHELCSSCHEAVATPKMLDCGGCHHLVAGMASSGAGMKDQGSMMWRVKAKFSHATHRTDTRKGKKSTAPLACKECHGDVENAGQGQTAMHPTMEGCAKTCHDGKIAFKTSGFGCTKCHGEDAPR
jgi:cytochrome c7-like protein